MRRLALTAFLAAALLAAAGAGPAGATNECRGLQVCVSIAGPWVIVPATGSASRTEVEFQLACPPRFVVGGLDAQLSDPRIALRFDGKLGSPVTPGVTTSTAAVFRAAYTGPPGRTASFQPLLGCIPASGGGGGIPTALRLFPPGEPVKRHVRNVDLHRGVSHVAVRCPGGARLVSGAHAVAFYSTSPPTPALAHAVTARHALRPAAVVAVARAGALQGVETVLQVTAVCTGGP